MKNLFLFLTLCLCSVITKATTYYVATNGSNSNPGTITAPFATWDKLSEVMVAGDIAYIRGGTYRSQYGNGGGVHCLWQNLKGTSTSPVKIWAYPGEYPILNLDNITPSYSDPTAVIVRNSSYVHIKGLRITGLKQNSGGSGISRGFDLQNASNCTIEFVELDHIGGNGYIISNGSNDNLFKNCDAHHMDDRLSNPGAWGGSNGWNCTGGTNATRNTFDGCRAWWISDDGFDLFGTNGINTFKNCWSFWNGYEPGTFIARGDGDGFKLGPDESYIYGGSSTVHNSIIRTLTNNLAFENLQHGFNQNVGDMRVKLYNNTSFKNGINKNGFGYMWDFVSPAPVQDFKNNISFMDNSVRRGDETTGSNNSWNGSVSISSADFLSISSAGADGPRQADGSLPNLNFLKLASTSDLVNSGANVGLPYLSSAPDMGAFEANGGTVNTPPTANAGTDKTITLPTNSLSLAGTGTDAGGSISAYQWTKTSGPSSGTVATATAATTTVSGLVQGVYVFELKVTDNNGATATDLVQVTVNAATVTNTAPTANAGADKAITLPTNSTSLSGSGTDAGGSISAYQWTKISGPTTGTIATPTAAATTLTALVQGVYKYELKVTDNGGLTAKDTVQVTVNGTTTTTNTAPKANAGINTGITLPTNTVTLKGSGTDANGTIASYQWIKISGPTGTITSPAAATTTVTNLLQGVYAWELKVTDNQGATGKDTVYTTVNAATTTTTGSKIIHVNIFNGSNAYSNAQWNNWKPAAGITSTNFKYEDGTVSTVNGTMSKQEKVYDNGSTYMSTATICPPQVLRYTSANRASRTFTLKGLDASKIYTIELFGSSKVVGTGSDKTEYVIGWNYIIPTVNNKNAYAEFFNVSPDASGSVVVTINSIGTWNYVSGFNIKEQTGTVSSSVARTVTTTEAIKTETAATSTTVTAFPLPFTTSFTVSLSGDVMGEFKLNLVDASGKTVWMKTITKSSKTVTENIYMGNLPNGVYILQVIAPDGTKTAQQLIKS